MNYISTSALALLMAVAPFAAFADDTNVSGHADVNLFNGTQPSIKVKGEGHAVIGNIHIFKDGKEVSSTTMNEHPRTATTTREDRPKGDGTTARSHGDASIDARIAAMTKLIARLGEAQRLTTDAKTSLTASLNAQIDALKTLKVKIDAGATTTLKDDLGSITKDFRVYALVMPKAAITAAADRIMTVVGQMEAVSSKVKARIDAASAAGTDVAASQTAYADFTAKIGDAKVQAQAAVSLIANLSVDGGDKAKMDANTAALKSAKAKIDAAQADLKAARADLGTILKNIKGTGEVKADASASVSN